MTIDRSEREWVRRAGPVEISYDIAYLLAEIEELKTVCPRSGAQDTGLPSRARGD
jgi:hypothetical protein